MLLGNAEPLCNPILCAGPDFRMQISALQIVGPLSGDSDETLPSQCFWVGPTICTGFLWVLECRVCVSSQPHLEAFFSGGK